MFGPTKIYFVIFGLLTIAGGIMGYVKAGSTDFSRLRFDQWFASPGRGLSFPGHASIGLALGGIVSLLLIGYFLPAFFRTGKMMPAGMMSLLSVLGVVFAIFAWIRK